MNQRPATYPLQQAAKLLGIGPKKLFARLRSMRVLNKDNVPYQRYIDNGYFKVHNGSWVHPEAGIQYYAKTNITNAGINWLEKQINAERETTT